MKIHSDPGGVVRPGPRREEILSSAGGLFWAKGYGATAMSEVAAQLGMQKGSLYHHVATKETLLRDLSLTSMRYMIAAVSAAPGATPRLRLEAIIVCHLTALLGEQSSHAAVITELRSLSIPNRDTVVRLRDEYDQIVEAAIVDVQRAEHLWPETSSKLLRLALLGMLNYTVFWFRGDHTDGSVGDIGHIFATIFLGPEVVTGRSGAPAADGVVDVLGSE